MKFSLVFIYVCSFFYFQCQNLEPYPIQDDAKLAWFEPANSPYQVGQHEKLEIGIALPEDLQYRIDNFIFKGDSPKSINPFLEWEIKVTAKFYHKSVLVKSVDGFYYKEFVRNMENKNVYARTWEQVGESYQRKGSSFNFRVRASLPDLGKYTCKITAVTKEQTITFAPIELDVVKSTNKGFVQVGKNKRYFTLGGETFYFIGQNINWPTKSGACKNEQGVTQNFCQPIIDTDIYCTKEMFPPDAYINFYNYIDTLSSHVNFIRTMMVPWSWDIEYEQVGNYASRMNIAWEMDRFFELCYEKGIYVNFDLSWGAELANPNVYGGAIWDWYDHPEDQIATKDEMFYGYKNKFNLKTLDDFRRHPEVKKFYAQKLRYFVARYGYSANLTMIEVANEMNGKEYDELAGRNSARMWHDFVCTYIKDSLHANQLTAVNYGNGYEVCTQNNICSGGTSDGDFSFSLDNVDVASYNFYTGPSAGKQIGLSYKFNRKQIDGEYNKWYYNLNKPIIIGETGFAQNIEVCAPKIYDGYDNAVTLSMSGFAGILLWDDKPEYYEKYHQLTNFMNDIDLDGENFHPVIPNFDSKYTHKSLNKMKRKDDKALVYYLKSKQRNPEIVGAIQNTTFNEYSMRNKFWDDGYDANGKQPPAEDHWKDTLKCAPANLNMPCDDLEWDHYNNKLNYGKAPYNAPEIVESKSRQGLYIYGLDLGQYKTDYYGAFNFNLIDSSQDGGFIKTLHHPPLDEENRIMLFKMKKSIINYHHNIDNNFIETVTPVQTSKINIQKDEDTYYLISNPSTPNLTYELYDLNGKLIQSDKIKSSRHTLHISYTGTLLLFVKQGNLIVYRDLLESK
jgi:hypothetical protein